MKRIIFICALALFPSKGFSQPDDLLRAAQLCDEKSGSDIFEKWPAQYFEKIIREGFAQEGLKIDSLDYFPSEDKLFRLGSSTPYFDESQGIAVRFSPSSEDRVLLGHFEVASAGGDFRYEVFGYYRETHEYPDYYIPRFRFSSYRTQVLDRIGRTTKDRLHCNLYLTRTSIIRYELFNVTSDSLFAKKTFASPLSHCIPVEYDLLVETQR